IAIDHDDRALSAWDGCRVARELLDNDSRDRKLSPDGATDPFSGCEVVNKDDHTRALSLGMEYKTWGPVDSSDQEKVAGEKAEVNEVGQSCYVRWNQGSSGVSAEWAQDTIGELSAQGCAKAKKLAGKAMEVWNSSPTDDEEVSEQQPLLYEPDEPDVAAVGACRYLPLLDSGPD